MAKTNNKFKYQCTKCGDVTQPYLNFTRCRRPYCHGLLRRIDGIERNQLIKRIGYQNKSDCLAVLVFEKDINELEAQAIKNKNIIEGLQTIINVQVIANYKNNMHALIEHHNHMCGLTGVSSDNFDDLVAKLKAEGYI